MGCFFAKSPLWIAVLCFFQALSGSAEIMVVATHCENRSKIADEVQSINQKFAKFTRNPIDEVYFVSSSSGHGVREFRRRLYEVGRKYCEELPMVSIHHLYQSGTVFRSFAVQLSLFHCWFCIHGYNL